MKLIRDILLVYRRQMRFSLRMPQWLFFALVQPVMYLALFGPLLKPLTGTPGFPASDPWRFFVPGLIVQLGIFGVLYAGFGLVDQIRFGVIDRMRVSPVARSAILLGQVLRDVTGWMNQPGYREVNRETVMERKGEALRIEIQYTRSSGVAMHSLALFQIDGTTFSMVNVSVEEGSWAGNEARVRELLHSYAPNGSAPPRLSHAPFRT